VLYRNSNSPYIERHLENIETKHYSGECCFDVVFALNDSNLE